MAASWSPPARAGFSETSLVLSFSRKNYIVSLTGRVGKGVLLRAVPTRARPHAWARVASLRFADPTQSHFFFPGPGNPPRPGSLPPSPGRFPPGNLGGRPGKPGAPG